MPHQALSLLATTMRSAKGWAMLVGAGKLHMRYPRIGNRYDIHGQRYVIFRETVSYSVAPDGPGVPVVGFRLHVIRSNRALHWLFQRLCILTTPFWCGLAGFRVKLWMVAPKSKDYIGVYDWRGIENAQKYLDFLLPILRFFSVKGTVWYEQRANESLENYLEEQQINKGRSHI